MTEVMGVYRRQVVEMAEKGEQRRIPNRSVEHASILIQHLFKGANQTIRILCGSLDVDFYLRAELVDALNNFLSKPKAILKIITTKEVDKNHQFILSFKDYINSGQIVMRFSDEVKVSERHFTVMDEVGYRFEFNHDPTDSKIVEAVANFNEPEVAKKLAREFDEVYDKAGQKTEVMAG